MNALTVTKLSDVFIGISGDAEAARAEALEVASVVTRVDSQATQELAVDALRLCADLVKSVEKSRTEVKRPVLELGRKIDGIAADFGSKLEAEANRIKRLIGDYQFKLLANQREEERARIAEANRIEMERQKAIAAVRTAETTEDRAEASKRLQEASEAKREAMNAEVATIEKPAGVRSRSVWRFEVYDLPSVLKCRPDFVELSPRVRVINDALSAGMRECPGLRIWEEMEVACTKA